MPSGYTYAHYFIAAAYTCTMLNGITGLLLLQLAGEGLSRMLHLPFPGPVVGFMLTLVVVKLRPQWLESLRTAATGLLSHLSLLFIPAGVGVVMYLHELAKDGLAIIVALVVSSWVGLGVTAWVAEKLQPKSASTNEEERI